MARKKKKDLQIARFIKDIPKYDSTALYDLSAPLKDSREPDGVSFIVISRPRPISGYPITTIWASDAEGNLLHSTYMFKFKGKNVKEWLLHLGYNLINA